MSAEDAVCWVTLFTMGLVAPSSVEVDFMLGSAQDKQFVSAL